MGQVCRPELGSFADTFAARAIALEHGACYVPEIFHIWHRLPGSFSDRTGRDLRKSLDIVARAETLMKSDEFTGRFPARYVKQWRSRQQRQIVWNYFLGDHPADANRSFLLRNLRRLPRLPQVARLLLYQGH